MSENISHESLLLIRFLIGRAIDYYTSEQGWPSDDSTIQKVRQAFSEIETEIDFRRKNLEEITLPVRFTGFSD